ncbi:flavodoxin family protein [Thalassovita taeanensis]|uniref:Flavodoxin n=1 Tax=Thalassovita taeanensis TaxID=657014 RepID=A0A1H9FUC3_9RHOB|nr:flavodoxin [Thalassovita taeanensis]SEQ41522.1 Flavodoxin [Thalassovita taeanensis]
MTRILILYFSRSGTTRAVAQALATRLGADIEELREPRARTGIAGYLRSAWEALKQRHVQLTPPTRRAEDYDLVLIGSPTWAGHLCAPVRSWLHTAKPDIRRYAGFVTQGGSGAEKVLAEMQTQLGTPPEATLILTAGQVNKGEIAPQIETFVQDLRL